MNDITFVIFTYNEEKRIERIIKNVKNYGKILLNDDHSTDNTREIALSYGCEILLRVKNYDFAEHPEMAASIYEKITTEWLFWMYADEMLDERTLTKIDSIIKLQSSKYDIIKIYRKNYFYGAFCYDLYQSANNRIFKKGAIDFTDNVIHGFGKEVVPTKRVYNLPDKYFIHQFIDYTASSYLNKMDVYTKTELKSEKNAKKSVWYFLFKIAKNLIRNYFFDKGYIAGFPALSLTELTLFYELIKNIKIYEQENFLTKQSIEEKNDIHRDFILNQMENNCISNL